MVARCVMLITEKWNLNPVLYFFARKLLKNLRAHLAVVMYTIWHHLYTSFLCYFEWWYMFGESSINTSPPPWGLNDLSIFKKLLNPFFCQEYLRFSDRHIGLSWHVWGFYWCCLLGFCGFFCCLGIFVCLFLFHFGVFLGCVLINICFTFS